MVIIVSNNLFNTIIMKRKDILTLVILIVLTIVTGLFSKFYSELKMVNSVILFLSGIKFLLVAFQFMELKKAHIFWKIILTSYLVLFCGIIILMLR
ncbi:MAG: hypothetical protein COA67_04630 [Lutibacter sp.]|nr:MAG: hypothetical protein COA67_04630 [Lutibacter sp.]